MTEPSVCGGDAVLCQITLTACCCVLVWYWLLTLLLILCGLTSQKTNQGGLGLSGSVHEEAHPCFPNFV